MLTRRWHKAFLCLLLVLTPAVGQAKIYLLSVGFADYPGEKNDLRLPTNDAKTMKWLYKKNQDSKVCLLTNSDATLTNVKEALRQLASLATADDIVVMFFSGHGVKGGFVCYDGYLYYKEIYSLLGACKSKNKMVFADACFSGAMRQGKKHGNPATPKKSNVMLFLSCRTNEMSIETPRMANGFFTHALQNGLRGKADANRDRTITAKELFTYVSRSVCQLSSNRQHPVMWGRFPNDMPVMKW